jgi:hypothetical protein
MRDRDSIGLPAAARPTLRARSSSKAKKTTSMSRRTFRSRLRVASTAANFWRLPRIRGRRASRAQYGPQSEFIRPQRPQTKGLLVSFRVRGLRVRDRDRWCYRLASLLLCGTRKAISDAYYSRLKLSGTASAAWLLTRRSHMLTIEKIKATDDAGGRAATSHSDQVQLRIAQAVAPMPRHRCSSGGRRLAPPSIHGGLYIQRRPQGVGGQETADGDSWTRLD